MTLISVALIGAITTLIGAASGFIVALRRSNRDGDNHWQDLVRAQLAAQIERTTNLWVALDNERSERRQVEAAMTTRIALLESILRQNGIALP